MESMWKKMSPSRLRTSERKEMQRHLLLPLIVDVVMVVEILTTTFAVNKSWKRTMPKNKKRGLWNAMNLKEKKSRA
jgi:hypothetical protein